MKSPHVWNPFVCQGTSRAVLDSVHAAFAGSVYGTYDAYANRVRRCCFDLLISQENAVPCKWEGVLPTPTVSFPFSPDILQKQASLLSSDCNAALCGGSGRSRVCGSVQVPGLFKLRHIGTITLSTGMVRLFSSSRLHAFCLPAEMLPFLTYN